MNENTEKADNPAATAGGFLARLDRIEQQSRFPRRFLLALPPWITPNRITIARGTLVVPAAALLFMEYYWAAAVTLVAMVLGDILDGALARARGPETPLGAFLDPLMDKLSICVPLVALALAGPLRTLAGWTVTVCVTVIEVALVAVRVIKKRRGIKDASGQADIKARGMGKNKMRVQSAALSMIIIGLAVGWPPLMILGVYLMGIAILLGIASFASHWPKRK
ncbi:MAG: CDP-alcohol phosphatidyltransferase family protein [Patescibacteria group bacterium]|nr:CDP-alcohol phosphatidyltransferase family protein [Patescibacteria group bacterium]